MTVSVGTTQNSAYEAPAVAAITPVGEPLIGRPASPLPIRTLTGQFNQTA
jgi:hypothetical protein